MREAEARAASTVVPSTVHDLVLRARHLTTGARRTILGVVGAPGAGKSTLCSALVARLGPRAAVAGMDGFHLSNTVLAELGRLGRKGAPDTFDVDGYLSLLRRLREAAEEVTYAPRFDRGLDKAIGSAVPIPRDVPLVITEGNYLLHDEGGWQHVRGLLDEVWYLDLPNEVRRGRLVARRLSNGHPADAAEAWVGQVDEPNALLTAQGRSRADLILQLLDPPWRP